MLKIGFVGRQQPSLGQCFLLKPPENINQRFFDASKGNGKGEKYVRNGLKKALCMFSETLMHVVEDRRISNST